MESQNKIDIIIIVGRNDFRLLSTCLESLSIFSRLNGKIHIFLWKSSEYLLRYTRLPENIEIHFKDDIPEMVEDDFRNQMYIKLISYRYAETDWIWLVDADFVLCDSLCSADFFDSEGKPHWFYRSWKGAEIAQARWQAGSEKLIGESIPFSFLANPPYLLNAKILAQMDKLGLSSAILNTSPMPSEFLVYGAYTYKEHRPKYSWIDLANSSGKLPFCVLMNQVRPSYLVLDDDVTLGDAPNGKCYVFWSHWDLAQNKMREFFETAQIKAFGTKKIERVDNLVSLKVTDAEIDQRGCFAWDGVYDDKWVKRSWRFEVVSQNGGKLFLGFENPLLCSTEVRLSVNGTCSSKNFLKKKNYLVIDCPAQPDTTHINVDFSGGVKEQATGRMLFVRAHHAIFFDDGNIGITNHSGNIIFHVS